VDGRLSPLPPPVAAAEDFLLRPLAAPPRHLQAPRAASVVQPHRPAARLDRRPRAQVRAGYQHPLWQGCESQHLPQRWHRRASRSFAPIPVRLEVVGRRTPPLQEVRPNFLSPPRSPQASFVQLRQALSSSRFLLAVVSFSSRHLLRRLVGNFIRPLANFSRPPPRRRAAPVSTFALAPTVPPRYRGRRCRAATRECR